MTMTLGLALLVVGVAVVQIPTGAEAERGQIKPEYSPYVDQHFPNRVFWGDTHHHSNYSFDDGLMGTRLTPEESYRFARSEELRSNTGLRAKLWGGACLGAGPDCSVIDHNGEVCGNPDLFVADASAPSARRLPS